MIRSIRFVLTLWYIGILTIILCLFSSTLYSTVSIHLDLHINETLASQADSIADTIFAFWKAEQGSTRVDTIQNEMKSGKFLTLIQRWFNQTHKLEKHLSRLVGTEGSVLCVSMYFAELQIPLQDPIIDKALAGHTSYQTINRYGRRFRLITRPIMEDGQVLYVVQIASSLKHADASLEQLRDWLLWLIPLTLFLTSAVGWFLATAALKPVGRMIQKAQSIGIKDLHERIAVPETGDELEQLAKTFNGLLSRLDKSFRRMRQFSAAAAHELRTPLSIMRGELEVTLRKPRENEEYKQLLSAQLEVLTELANIVEQLLTLAYAEEGEEAIQWEKIRLGQLIERMLQVWQKAAEKKEIMVHFSERDPALILGEKRLLERLVANFLDNAIKHTPPHGQITIETVRNGDEACLVVQDSGSGITPEELPRIFDKFFSQSNGNKSGESGVGLGLGLCRWIAESHKGRIEVEAAPGKGARFVISFPTI